MARGIHRLTQLQLKRARKRGLYGDGGGLYCKSARPAAAVGCFATSATAARG